jgi:hypothetical protein
MLEVVEPPVKVTLEEVHVICKGVAILIFGNAPVEVTITEEVFVHPLEGFVAVTVYVPAVVTVAGFAAFVNVPPFHTIVFPRLVPVNVALGDEQVMFPELTDVKAGGVVLLVIFTVEVFVQPLAALVAVTVYVPAALTVAGLVALVNVPPFQTIVFPALVPVKVTLVVVQVILPELTEVTAGGVVLDVTLITAEFEQLDDASDTTQV